MGNPQHRGQTISKEKGPEKHLRKIHTLRFILAIKIDSESVSRFLRQELTLQF